tara:strand:+ start:1587 stop:2444 length:858 start_codon:yes stop_codon:yes gene_type:complete
MLYKIKQKMKGFLLALPSKANYKFVLKNWISLFDLKYSSMVLETKRFCRNLSPQLLDRPIGRRILILAPHPDDDVFGLGGTLLKLSNIETEIKTLYFTNATENTFVIKKIQREAEEVCCNLNSTPLFLNYPTRNIPVTEETLKKIKEEVIAFGPEIVALPFLLDDHDDHRRVNEVLFQSLKNVNISSEIWAYQIYSTLLPNVVVDITEQIDKKEQLMRIFQSVSGNRNWAHYIRGMNAANCRYIPGKSKVYGEAFFVVPLSEYLDLCEIYFSNPHDKIYYEPNYY